MKEVSKSMRKIDLKNFDELSFQTRNQTSKKHSQKKTKKSVDKMENGLFDNVKIKL